ncbi:MAG: hypothetical protein ACOC97_05575 [Myxococcota bacterium]
MSAEARVVTGAIPPDGVLGLLRQVESLRTTGVLRFRGEGRRGEVRLVRGELATDQPVLDDGSDPVEVLLRLRSGEYEVVQVLPPLPVSGGDGGHRRGSLEVHVPADLMRYCEQAGLTGTLRFEKGARSACAVYDRGELVGIRVDGREDADLHQVFGWEEGSFEIEARTLAPSLEQELELDEPAEEEDATDRDPTIPRMERRRDETGRHFLRVVEVTLSQVMHDRESYRPPTRSSPPLPPLPAQRSLGDGPLASGAAPPGPTARRPEEREATVKIVYHSRATERSAGPVAVPVVARPVSEERGMAEEDERPETAEAGSGPALDQKADESSLEAAPPVHAPDADGRDVRRTSLLGTAAWIAVVAGLALVTIRLLAWMPPLE